MKRKLSGLMAFLVLFLGGCSLLEEAKDTASYAGDVKEYVDKALAFAEEIPAKAEQAINDEQAREELKQSLEEMNGEIEAFANIEAPEALSGLHSQIEEKNAQLQEKIDIYQQHLENGTLDKEILKNEEIAQPIEDIKGIFDQIKEFGQ